MPRKRARLSHFDYGTPGAYFITICAHRRKQISGRCVDDELRPTAAAGTVERCWAEIPAHFPGVIVDVFIVMPNHVHGTLLLGDGAHPLPTIVGSFKSAVSRELKWAPRVWQRGYHERVVRSENDLEAFRRYILENPVAWASDPENPARTRIAASAPWL